ncbi:MAG TPA: TolC family protein [Pedobacter sp.]|uniref:TolC family protein n=1 Tax=Pedobacter sp. TaxID=1411316 RepID=UPI002B779B53|nr:TolC family protein [Pedobacter sp.]HMI01313.1 TolC family protein [Pedobacter sp.]
MVRFRKILFTAIIYSSAFRQGAVAQTTVNGKKDLEYFITRATASSLLIKDFSNQVLINKIDSMRIRSGYGPKITASSTGLYAPRIHGYGFDEVMTNGQSLDALLNVNYALTGKDMKANQTRSLALQRDSLNYAIGMSRLDLQKAITEQYLQAYDSQQQVEFNRDVFGLLKNEEVLLKKLTRSNVYKQTEYLTFLVTFRQQQLQYKQAEVQLKTDLANLNYLAGIKDTTAAILVEPKLKQEGAVRSGNSFFFKRFEIDSLKAVIDRKAVDLSYRPKAGIYINGGYNSSLVLQPYKNFGASIGFTVSVPIYDGHQRKMQQDKINLQARTSADYRSFFQSQQALQIDMLYQQIEATKALFGQIDEQIRLTRGLIDVDSKLLRTGDIRVADFVIAINNYMVAQNLRRQTNINRLKLISQLSYWNH